MTEFNTYYDFQVYVISDDEDTKKRCSDILKKLRDHGHYYMAFDVTKCKDHFLKQMKLEDKGEFPFVYAEGQLIEKYVEGFIEMLDMSNCFRGTTDEPQHLVAKQIAE